MRTTSLSLVQILPLLTVYVRCAQCILLSNGSISNGIPASGRLHSSAITAAQRPKGSSSAHVQNSTSPTNPSGLRAAIECWSQWDAYSTSSTECPKTTITGSTLTFTSKVVSTVDKTFKLCDGHPRAIATGGERTSTSLGELSGTPYTTYTIVHPPSGVPVSTERTLITATTTLLEASCATPVPTPKCSIGNDDCKALFSSWTAGGFSKLRPPCTYALPTKPCDNCYIYIPSVRLIYFPVSMTGDFCGSYSTVTPSSLPNVSTPTTVQVSGITFTSGLAYLSYAGVTATGPNGNCGATKPAGILPIPSSEVFSYRGHAAAMAIAGDIQYPFNFADLAPNPVPWDAWISQETCFTQQDYPTCQTITQAAYRPGIVYPSAFWSLDPQWSNCVSGIFGIVDPPTALPKVREVAQATAPTAVVDPTASAAPEQDPGGSGVVHTSSREALGTEQRPGPSVPAEPSKPTNQGTRIVSTKQIPTSVLRTSTLSVGSLAIVRVSRHDVVSVGTNVLSDGEATTIGHIVVSLHSDALVLGVEQSASEPHSEPLNAVSILAAAQTQGKPSAKFTIGGEVYTAYPGGMIAGSETTIDLFRHSAITMAGHLVSIHDGTVWIDSSSVVFTHSGASSSVDPQAIAMTFDYGTSRTTLSGHIDSNGNTILTFGTSTLTYTGSSFVEDGTTYTALGITRDPTQETGLPKVVAAATSTSARVSPSAARPGASSSTTTSSSNGLVNLLEGKVALAVLLLLLSVR